MFQCLDKLYFTLIIYRHWRKNCPESHEFRPILRENDNSSDMGPRAQLFCKVGPFFPAHRRSSRNLSPRADVTMLSSHKLLLHSCFNLTPSKYMLKMLLIISSHYLCNSFQASMNIFRNKIFRFQIMRLAALKNFSLKKECIG